MSTCCLTMVPYFGIVTTDMRQYELFTVKITLWPSNNAQMYRDCKHQQAMCITVPIMITAVNQRLHIENWRCVKCVGNRETNRSNAETRVLFICDWHENLARERMFPRAARRFPSQAAGPWPFWENKSDPGIPLTFYASAGKNPLPNNTLFYTC